LGYWTERLIRHGVRFERPDKRFDESVLRFNDPHGLAIELVARPARDGGNPWQRSPVPPKHAIQGIAGVTLSERSAEVTMDLLVTLLGFEKAKEEDGRTRYLTTSSGGSFAHYRNKQTGSSG
jgi:glyoxalase family protein